MKQMIAVNRLLRTNGRTAKGIELMNKQTGRQKERLVARGSEKDKCN